MDCNPQTGYVAIPSDLFWDVIALLIIVACIQIGYNFDRYVMRPGLRLKRRKHDWKDE